MSERQPGSGADPWSSWEPDRGQKQNRSLRQGKACGQEATMSTAAVLLATAATITANLPEEVPLTHTQEDFNRFGSK